MWGQCGLDTSSSAAEAEECDADTLGYEPSEPADSDSEIHSINIRDQIQQWALKYQIPHNALGDTYLLYWETIQTRISKNSYQKTVEVY